MALLPCPFCGSSASFFEVHDAPGVICDSCGADIMARQGGERADARRLWNARHFHDQGKCLPENNSQEITENLVCRK